MEIDAEDRHLNLFQFFGGDYANENNTTRTLMIALTRSQWSPIILRGFFDAVLGKLRNMGCEVLRNIPCETLVAAREIFGAWPASLRVRMQQGAASADFIPGDTKLDSALLLEIAPESEKEAVEADDGQPAADDAVKPGGITDACLIATSRDDKTMAIVIESKLYGRAGEDQMGKYEAAIKERCRHGNAPIRMELKWEDIYSLLGHLPEEASFDPILRDFARYLNERPWLVGFTGFGSEDFADRRRLDTQLYRLCQRIARDGAGDYRFEAEVVRVRLGCDYNLCLNVAEGKPKMQGNLGILASPELATVSSKLALGWRTYEQTTYVLDNKKCEDAAVLECISALGGTGVATIDLYFGCQILGTDVPEFARRRYPVTDWKEACALAMRYHRKKSFAEVVDEILGCPGVEEWQPGLSKLRATERRNLVKACLVVLITRDQLEAAGLTAQRQRSMFQGDLKLLADLLTHLSSKPA